MAKNNARSRDATRPVAVPSLKPIVPLPTLDPKISEHCRCGGNLSRGTMPDGTPAWARVHLVPEGFSPALLALNAPQLDAAIFVCEACNRIEFKWSGR